jgi:hypothetical protein
VTSEAEHDRVAVGLARLAEPPPDVGVETLKYLGLDPASVQAHAVVVVSRRFRLDPILNHVAVFKGKVYITRDGMLEIAHRSGQLDGIVVDEERESDHGYSATVSVHRKDMGHPFTYRGGCGVDEPQAVQGNGAEMALARAERRALRRAFNIPAYDDETDEAGTAQPDPDEHRIMPPTDAKDRWYTCSCGERFDTIWGHATHRNTQPRTPGSVAPAPAMPRPADPGPKPWIRREPGPPPSFYDSLPEARGR